MNYLYGYLAIGVAVLAVVLAVHWRTRQPEPESLRDLLDAINPDRKRLSHRIKTQLVVPVLASAVILIAWPVALYMKARDTFWKKRGVATGPEKEREFSVERRHLLERLTVQQIEAREVVTDPLGAVPILPFGHLNAAWKRFMKSVDAQDELWSFTANCQTKWGCKEVRTGYVVVRNGVPGPHLVTVWKAIEEQQK